MDRIIPHPLYSAQNHDYDVALLRLRTPLTFSGEALARVSRWGCGGRSRPWGTAESRPLGLPPGAGTLTALGSSGDHSELRHHLDWKLHQLLYMLFWGQGFSPRHS